MRVHNFVVNLVKDMETCQLSIQALDTRNQRRPKTPNSLLEYQRIPISGSRDVLRYNLNEGLVSCISQRAGSNEDRSARPRPDRRTGSTGSRKAVRGLRP